MKTSFFCALAPFSIAFGSSQAFAGEDDQHHQLDEIIVSAIPLGRTVEALTQSTSVLAGDELTRSQSTSIGETLAKELGVSATYFGPVASRPVIRGQYGERVLVLSNGLDALDASALSEDHASSVDNLIADRIEIVRGPATLIYGSGAAGGIVNVVDSRIHEEALDQPLSGAVSLNSDSALGAESVAATFDVGNDLFVGHFDFMSRQTDDVEIPGFAESEVLRTLEGELDGEPEGTIENTSSETDSFALGVSMLGENGNFFGVSFTDYQTNYGIPGEHAHEEEEAEGEGAEEEIISIDLDQERIDVRGQLYIGSLFEAARLKFAQNDYAHTEFEGDEVGTVYENDSSDLRIDLLQKATDQLSGTIGLQYKRIDLNAVGEEAFVPSSDTDQYGLYAYQEWQLSDRWITQGSARIERQSISVDVLENYSGSALGASLGSIFEINDDLKLSANLSMTERHPNATELYAFGPHLAVSRFERGSVVLGNGELDKETSTNLDVTLRGSGGPFSWTVTAFQNDVQDYIVLSPTDEIEDDLQVFDYRQTDAVLYGLEAEVLADLIDTQDRHLHARLFTDFVHAEEDSGEYLPRITPMRVGAGLHFVQGGLDAEVTATRHSSQSKLAANELPTDGFTLLDASASYRIDELLVFVRGSNLTDEDARRHTSPLKDVAPLPGRSIHLGLRYDF